MAKQQPLLTIANATLAFGDRVLWENFSCEVFPGEFIAILGPNGSGKSSLLKAILGQHQLARGTVTFADDRRIGYIPQQKGLSGSGLLRGVDFVGLGDDGNRWGTGFLRRKQRKILVDNAIVQVGADSFAGASIAQLSGGEQQRLRIAQALVGDPGILLCDEPLLSLDLASQATVARLINQRRENFGTAVMFVTHEINPILPYVDRVIYLVDGDFRVGAPEEVLTTETLSELYRSEVQVMRVGERIVVVGSEEPCHDHGLHGGIL